MEQKIFTYQRGILCVEGVSVERIARDIGTPTYVYSSAHILARLRECQQAFAAQSPLICYALKANSNKSLCRLLAQAGVGAEVVSGGELRRALGAGFPPERVVFSGVGKTSEEMAAALRAGILALNIESAEEMECLSHVARRLRKVAPFSIRLIPGVSAGAHAHVVTGSSDSKFGVEFSQAIALYKRSRRDPWLCPVGIQSHIGSQITRIGPYQKALGVLLKAVEVLADSGIPLRYLDIGGGMGIQYSKEQPLDLSALARSVAEKLSSYPQLRLVLEPGRYLVGGCGLLLTRVLFRKRSSRRRFVVVDAAMNDLARPALYQSYHEIAPVQGLKRRKVLVDVVGPICESGDFLGHDRRLPWPEPGELWAVFGAGAYGFSMSSQYNSRLRAAEVLVSKAGYRIVRGRETFADLVRHER